MGKMDALLTQATAAIPPATPPPEAWGHETLATEEPPPTQAAATLDEAVEAATQIARETAREAPTPTEPRELEPPVVKVVEPTPVIRAVERLHQGVQAELRAVKAEVQEAAAVARRQEDYLREVQRAHNAMTTDWYEIAAGLPAIRVEVTALHAEIATRRAALTALREEAEEETRAAVTMQVRELEAVLRRVRTVATRAVLLVALVSLLAVIVVAVLATMALHRPL